MNKIIVCKVGGALVDNQSAMEQLLLAFADIQDLAKIILVHGGGNGVERLLSSLDMPSQKIDGLRVTPQDQIPFVVGALAGTTNKQLCATGIKCGLSVIGLSLLDGNSIACHQLSATLGAVGVPSPVDPTLLTLLIDKGFLPIISSIGSDTAGQLYNVNADQAATAIAQLLHADLFLLSDVPGVLNEHKVLIPVLDSTNAERLMINNTITEGMAVKVKAAQLAADTLQRPVVIGSWSETSTLKDVITSNKATGFGTQVLPVNQTINA